MIFDLVRKVFRNIRQLHTHKHLLLNLCMHISHILAYSSTLLSLIFNEPNKHLAVVQWFPFQGNLWSALINTFGFSRHLPSL